jgi:hypothetical protein
VQLPQGKSYVTRTRIKTLGGESWLTVPVENKGALGPITATRIAGNVPWQRKHWRTLEVNYRRSAHFRDVASHIGRLYEVEWDRLLDFNAACIQAGRDLMGLTCELVTSSDLGVAAPGTEHILGIVEALGGDTYVTGTGAGSARYMDVAAFAARGIAVEPFDFLFNCGRAGWDAWLASDAAPAR